MTEEIHQIYFFSYDDWKEQLSSPDRINLYAC